MENTHPVRWMSITIITNWHNVIFYRTEANKNVDRNYLSKQKYSYNYLWSAWCMLTPRYKNKFFLVNFLFVHCNDKKDTVERTLYRRKQFSTTIFSDYEKKLKEIIF